MIKIGNYNLIIIWKSMTNLLKKINNLKKLLKLGEILSKGFKFVRVDFYILNNDTIKFGEMTFHPHAGIQKWESNKTDKIMGEKIKINLNKKYEDL